ncbi:PNK3P-domain-containing protein [Ascobolus immersus RN42]|uniref:PNK3P-domain-containing protein n=1 Tax=Ascobolus immersus RN42 TaxID=1160509 RepID=A0A3N4ITU9_ASCIM|nr:PNK3P-domain-containing protein [Ascobolus immersus RN42]
MSPSISSKRATKTSTMERAISPPPLRTTHSSAKVTTTTTTSTYRLSLHAHPTQNPSWHQPTHTLMVAHYTSHHSINTTSKPHPAIDPATPSKIAAFDLDHTLTAPKTGSIHSQSATDWRFLYPCIPTTLRNLSATGYKIIIFTNQGGLKPEYVGMFKAKIAGVLAEIDVDCIVYVARGDDRYRKPRTGMWGVMRGDVGGDVDMEACFYVGDAAGREGDHSNADKGFAEGVGLRFYTPEEFFLGEKPKVEEKESSGEESEKDDDGHLDSNGSA